MQEIIYQLLHIILFTYLFFLDKPSEKIKGVPLELPTFNFNPTDLYILRPTWRLFVKPKKYKKS